MERIPYSGVYKDTIELFVLPKRITFGNTKLSEKKSKAVLDFLKDQFEEMAEDIDYFSDNRGRIILTDKDSIEENLKEVV
jgi:hypothetical protein